MDVAIYECDWHSAPFAFRKLVLMFLIRCKKPIQVKAAPFYELNRPLIALVSDHYVLIVNIKRLTFQITRRIYGMVTLGRQFLN